MIEQPSFTSRPTTCEFPSADGTVIRGDSWGDASRTTVVLLHGGGQTRHAWKQAGHLLDAAGYRAIAFDARGHGESDWAPDGRYGRDPMIEDLCTVIQQSGAVRPVLVGASMGGEVALVAAGEGTVDVAGVVLVDIAPMIEFEGAETIKAFMRPRPDGFASLQEAADAISAYLPHREAPPSLEGLAKNLRQRPDGRYRWHWDPSFMDGFRDDDRQVRLEGAARGLRTPTLLIRGGLSDILSEAGARHFLEICPQAEYVDIPNAAHMVAGDLNDVFTAAVLEFLGRVAPPHRASIERR